MQTDYNGRKMAHRLATLASLAWIAPALAAEKENHPISVRREMGMEQEDRLGRCVCGGWIYATTSGKPRCVRCKKVGKFKHTEIHNVREIKTESPATRRAHSSLTGICR